MFATVFSTFLMASLVAADVPVLVQHDATYAIPSSRGAVCAGVGSTPTGLACPLKGDIATSDCHSYLLSFNGTDCVAPDNAQCTTAFGCWGCVFPGSSSGSSGVQVDFYGSASHSASGGGYDDAEVGDEEGTLGGFKDGEYVVPATSSDSEGVDGDYTIVFPNFIKNEATHDQEYSAVGSSSSSGSGAESYTIVFPEPTSRSGSGDNEYTISFPSLSSTSQSESGGDVTFVGDVSGSDATVVVGGSGI